MQDFIAKQSVISFAINNPGRVRIPECVSEDEDPLNQLKLDKKLNIIDHFLLKEHSLAEIAQEYETSEEVISEILFPLFSVGDHELEKKDGIANLQARTSLPKRDVGSPDLRCSVYDKVILTGPCNLQQLLAEARQGMIVRGRDAMFQDKGCAFDRDFDWTVGCSYRRKGEKTKSTPLKLLDEIISIAWEQILLRELYRVLIKPIEHCLLQVEELLILPHKELFEVPWAALVDEHGCYMIQRHMIRIAPSLRVTSHAFKRLQPHVSTSHGHALVIGNPSPNLIGDLPQAEKEAKLITDILNSIEIEVRSLNKQAATKSRVRKSLEGAHWVHMACHSDVDTDSLVLATPLASQNIASGSIDRAKEMISETTQRTNTIVSCGGCCASPVVGTRWKCEMCEDFHLCDTCYSTFCGATGVSIHFKGHRFLSEDSPHAANFESALSACIDEGDASSAGQRIDDNSGSCAGSVCGSDSACTSLSSLSPAPATGTSVTISIPTSVSFTDTENLTSTLKLTDATGRLSWHSGGRCYLEHISVLKFDPWRAAICAPEHSALTAQLVDPAAGPDRDRLLCDIASMARSAGGVQLVGFPEEQVEGQDTTSTSSIGGITFSIVPANNELPNNKEPFSSFDYCKLIGDISKIHLWESKTSLRFRVGTHVQCKHPNRGWSKPWVTGRVRSQNFEQPAGIFNAYQIRLDNGAGVMIIETDHDDYVKHFVDAEEGQEEQAKEINLTIDEIQRNIKLSGGATVVLSACNTALGLITAEGVLGMIRGFFVAGADATVASLWSVDDESTAWLMQFMYQYLVKGLSVPHALRLAMLRVARRPLLSNGAGCDRIQRLGDNFHQIHRPTFEDTMMPDIWRRPLYWAGFLVVGASTHLPGLKTSEFDTSMGMESERREKSGERSSALAESAWLPGDTANSGKKPFEM